MFTIFKGLLYSLLAFSSTLTIVFCGLLLMWWYKTPYSDISLEIVGGTVLLLLFLCLYEGLSWMGIYVQPKHLCFRHTSIIPLFCVKVASSILIRLIRLSILLVLVMVAFKYFIH